MMPTQTVPNRSRRCNACGTRYEPYPRRSGAQRFCCEACRVRDFKARQKLLFPPGPVRALDEPPRDQADRLTAACARIMARLQQGPATNLELAALAGLRFGARIFDLRKMGHPIRTGPTEPSGRVVYRLEVAR